MEAWVKVFIGLGFFGLCLGYLYRPAVILRLYGLARDIFFNDTNVLLHRRRLGLFFFAIAVLFLYDGFNNLALERSRQEVSPYYLVNQAYAAYRAAQYKEALDLCQQVVLKDPDNIHAWTLVCTSNLALGRKAEADLAWAQMVRLDPTLLRRRDPPYPKRQSPSQK